MNANNYNPKRIVDIQPKDPAVKRLSEWLSDNRAFYSDFGEWLNESGFCCSAFHLYRVAARQALGYLDKPYWTIDPDVDIKQVWQHIQERSISPGTKADYHKGLKKLAEYLRLRCHLPPRKKEIRWDHYLERLPETLAQAVREYVALQLRNCPPEKKHEMTIEVLTHTTLVLRWLADRISLEDMANINPKVWEEYVDHRLELGLSPTTINIQLSSLLSLLHFLDDQCISICQRMFLVEPLNQNPHIHRDVPAEQLAVLLTKIQQTAQSPNKGIRRAGKLDLAWFLLMLHSGLRTMEVRMLKLTDLDMEHKKAFIEQSKGFKDRIVFLSHACLEAIQSYLEVRGPQDALPEQVFIYAHKPLSRFYCGRRLHTYGQYCGVDVTPHQLRHSNATLLLNAGAPVLSVQALLGHKYVDTTLRYARLYDGTIAADYYQAMADVEGRLALPEDRLKQPQSIGELLALVDALKGSMLNPAQAEIVRQLRTGISLLAE